MSVLLLAATAGMQIPAGELLWLQADAGVVTDENQVVQVWQDQSPNGHDATRIQGTMERSLYPFPGGAKPVIDFHGDGWLELADAETLMVPDLTVFAVIDVAPEVNEWNRCEYFNIYSNVVGWGYGFCLGTTPGRKIHYGTFSGRQAGYNDPWSAAVPGPDSMHIITVTISRTNHSKSVYYDGVPLSSESVPDLQYHATCIACIGSLMGLNLFTLNGPLAELIAYPWVDATQQSQVEAYLLAKYNAPVSHCGNWGYYDGDLNHDCFVDMQDFLLLAEQWLRCTDPSHSPCGESGEILKEIEQNDTHLWVAEHFSDARPVPAFSFTYQGISSRDILNTWSFSKTCEKLDMQRIRWTLNYSDPRTGLSIRCEATEYQDYPAVEWVVYFSNTSEQDTAILENIQVLDAPFLARTGTGEFLLRYSRGCNQLITDFKPENVVLNLDETLRLGSSGGRSSSALMLPPETDRANSTGTMPYFNLSKPDKNGVMMAVGWSGQWAAAFTKTSNTTLQVKAGMELTHLKLHPGEEIRTPSLLLLFWSGGDTIRGHNRFRRLLLDHYSPTPGGILANPPVAASPHGTIGFCDSTAANMIQGITHVADQLPPVDTWWIDAGWYACMSIPNVAPWNFVGTWEADPVRYPNGLKPVADAAHARGLKFLLWFEVERAVQGTWIYNQHPEWLLGHDPLPPGLEYEDPFYLVDFGNLDALAWAKDKFSRMIQEVGIDIYRIDLNMDPLYYWRHNEPWDRQGMREIKHIMGWYEYLDTLMRENPNLLIDNCAGGGRRLDLEMVRRSVSLTPSDYLWEPVGEQAMTYALSLWIPLHGIGSISLNPYDCRSGMGTSFVAVFDFFNRPEMWVPATKILNEYQSIKPYYSGDFYPLTDYSVEAGDWMAWQFDRPDLGQGMVQAFRRSGSTASAMSLHLKGLNPAAIYTLTDLDHSGTTTESGAALMNTGLEISLPAQPDSAIIIYQRL